MMTKEWKNFVDTEKDYSMEEAVEKYNEMVEFMRSKRARLVSTPQCERQPCEKALKKQYVQKKVISDRYREKEIEFSDRLFVTKFNTPLNVQIFNEAIDRIVKEMNLMKNELEQMEKFTGHTFRHTFATRCIESGVQPKTLQKYLGHATLQMTMDLYVHTTDEHKQEEMKKLESSLENLREDEQKFNEKFEKEMVEDNKIVTFAPKMA